MFNGYKAAFAKNRVIMELVHQGLIDKRQEPLMKDIAGNTANIQYAVSLLRQRVAKCKYSAAAGAFAFGTDRRQGYTLFLSGAMT